MFDCHQSDDQIIKFSNKVIGEELTGIDDLYRRGPRGGEADFFGSLSPKCYSRRNQTNDR